MRIKDIVNTQPYAAIGRFGGLPFWSGGLTLLAAAPGVGKTSWLLRAVADAAAQGVPAALACYEHTPEELRFRLEAQARAAVGGAHGEAAESEVEAQLARWGEASIVPLRAEDSLSLLETLLIEDENLPPHGPALVAVDYLQNIPVMGLTSLLPQDQAAPAAAAGLRELARRHGWALVAASALKASAFHGDDLGLESLLGNDRLAYHADRVYLIERSEVLDCGCSRLVTHTFKDRTGTLRDFEFEFWGARFYPAVDGEAHG